MKAAMRIAHSQLTKLLEAHELTTMTELSKAVSKFTLKVLVKTGDDGKMFGSVTNGHIADELKRQYEIALDKKKIHIEKPIRTLGEHEIELHLHPDVKTSLKVVVESTTPLPKVEESPAADAKKTDAKGDKGADRGDRKARPVRAAKA